MRVLSCQPGAWVSVCTSSPDGLLVTRAVHVQGWENMRSPGAIASHPSQHRLGLYCFPARLQSPLLPPTRSGLQLPQCQRHFCISSLMVDWISQWLKCFVLTENWSKPVASGCKPRNLCCPEGQTWVSGRESLEAQGLGRLM